MRFSPETRGFAQAEAGAVSDGREVVGAKHLGLAVRIMDWIVLLGQTVRLNRWLSASDWGCVAFSSID